MEAEGMEILYHIKDMAFLGFVEVIKHLPFIRKVKRDVLEKVKTEGIKEAVLIDYPGFNLSLAKELREMGVRIVYYISPQIWAWGQGRIKKIKKLVDQMLVVFPFEETLYKAHDVPVRYVGHPLTERIAKYDYLSKEELYDKLGLSTDQEILLIMPGSRIHEIERIMEECSVAAKKIADKYGLIPVIACSDNIDQDVIKQHWGNAGFKMIKGNTYDLLKYSRVGIIKSGTSTLEAALLGLPHVVVYKTNKITYLLGRMLIKINNIAIANIIAGEDVVKELIQDDMNSEEIVKSVEEILTDNKKTESIEMQFEAIRGKLSLGGASKTAAEEILAGINEL